MAYAYWKAGKTKEHAVFNLFFRKNPFHGEFTIFAGLEECLKFVQNFRYSTTDIAYLQSVLPDSVEPEFFDFLRQLTAEDVVVHALDEGEVAFPRVPLLVVEGPLIVCQLLETTLLTLVNFASLMATNAARYRMAAGLEIRLLEFGLRRSQGPDGGLSASKYAYMGGFDGTSNVLAGKLFNIPVNGTHAHAYVTSFSELDELQNKCLVPNGGGEPVDILALALAWREKLALLFMVLPEEASTGELAAFLSFAMAYPNGFLALIDTSGLLNFCAVALALHELNYRALGVRIDSGDLAYLSRTARDMFEKISREYDIPWFATLTIVASNDINEETIISLNEQEHSINCFGIGTHLVTCQRQPALGCVYKLVEINGKPRMKLSQEVEKVTIPGRSACYRLFGKDDSALIDLMTRYDEPAPDATGVQKTLCRHPFQEKMRTYVSPSKVVNLHRTYWKDNKVQLPLPTLFEVRQRVQQSLRCLRKDIKRNLNPTPYKVGVSVELYKFLHDLWLEHAPIGELV
ncbi:nicotinate phosphoribosyltransferase-like isoform X2 [Pollicipes pollicipes]|uniref:nicotinate phosphoribosyltransferase-like isoform X2 n=1 Tax=Pollicipes pollicipes TaxID=41117 RepID=UPI001884E0F8|nr:nicotinate phosphoribosyltransferase-like isoform X2 [Pollicipes pollicipes]